jgi:hypothetical protein
VINFILLVFNLPRQIYHCSSTKQGAITIFLLVYVNDIIVVSSSSSVIDALLRDLNADFALKGLSPLHYLLGIEDCHTVAGLTLSQEKYTVDLLRQAGMQSCKPAVIPLSSSEKLSAQGGGGAQP